MYQYDVDEPLLVNFQKWWDTNTQERLEVGVEPLSHPDAVDMFCGIYRQFTKENFFSAYNRATER